MKKKLIYLGAATFIGLIVVIMILNDTSKNLERTPMTESGEIVAYVNGIPVEKEEMNLMMQLSGLTSDREVSDRLLEIKVAQQIAEKHGILQDSSFSAFLEELDIENKRRANSLNNKEVIYGPKQYSKLSYYDYRQALMMNSLKLMWSEQELEMNDDKLKHYYEQHRETLAKKHDTITIYKIVQSKAASENAKKSIFEIQQKMREGEPFLSLYHQLEQEQNSTEIEMITEENYREVSKYRSGYYHQVTQMSRGQVSDVLEDEKGYSLVMIAERIPGGYKNFAEIREEVIGQYTDTYFELFLKEQIANSEVKMQHEG